MQSGAGLVFLGFSLIMASVIVMSVRIYQVKPEFVKKILSYLVIGIVGLIFSVISIIIGIRIDDRHKTSYSRSLKSVQKIWGGYIAQNPPQFSFERFRVEQYEDKKTGQIRLRKRMISTAMGFESQKIDIKINSNIRTKGLLKFPGYVLEFSGKYVIRNLHKSGKKVFYLFQLPVDAGNISKISVTVDGKPYRDDTNLADGIDWSGYLNTNEKKVVEISYSARGTESFRYSLGQRKVEIKMLEVTLLTDFTDINIPDGSMVPTSRVSDDKTTKLTWKGENLVTGQNIAIKFEIEGNWGKIVSKLFFYSPLAIFLFLGFFIISTVSKEIRLHPMHYLFIVTGFFIFYLLGSYMISYMHIIAAVIISLTVSSGIMTYYSFMLKKSSSLTMIMVIGAGIFQWIFSIAFFFPQHTGFMITIASIIAFIFLMRSTVSVEWEKKW